MLKYLEKKNYEICFFKATSRRVVDVLEDIVPDAGTEVWEIAKAMRFMAAALEVECACA